MLQSVTMETDFDLSLYEGQKACFSKPIFNGSLQAVVKDRNILIPRFLISSTTICISAYPHTDQIPDLQVSLAKL